MEILALLFAAIFNLVVIFTALGRLSEIIELQRTSVRLLAKIAGEKLEVNQQGRLRIKGAERG